MKVETAMPRPLPDQAKNIRHEEPAMNAQSRRKEAVIQGETVQDKSVHSAREAESAITKINQTTEAFNIGLRFKLHEASDRVMVQIIDVEENEIIKEIPPEKLLNLAAQIQDMIGLMLDTKR